MRPGREMDCEIAEKIFGHNVFVKKRVLHEETRKGDRPLRFYSRDIESAWDVVEKCAITVIPIENGQWFALAAPEESSFGWKSPATFLQFLQKGDFMSSGAAVGPNIAQIICIAALKAHAAREVVKNQPNLTENSNTASAVTEIHH